MVYHKRCCQSYLNWVTSFVVESRNEQLWIRVLRETIGWDKLFLRFGIFQFFSSKKGDRWTILHREKNIKVDALPLAGQVILHWILSYGRSFSIRSQSSPKERPELNAHGLDQNIFLHRCLVCQALFGLEILSPDWFLSDRRHLCANFFLSGVGTVTQNCL